MNLRSILAAIRRSWIVVVVVIGASVVAGALVVTALPDSYSTTTKVLFQPAAAETGSSSGSTTTARVSGTAAAAAIDDQLDTYAALTTTAQVLDPVAAQVGGSSVALRDDVSAKVDSGTAIIEIQADGTTGQAAAELANAVSKNLIDQVAKLDPTGTGASAAQGTVVDAPIVPTSSGDPGPIAGGVLGLVAGLLLAYLVVVIREALSAPQELRRA